MHDVIVSIQGVDERIINVHYYYYYMETKSIIGQMYRLLLICLTCSKKPNTVQ